MQATNVTIATNSYYIYSTGRVHGGVSVNLESGLNSSDPRRRDRVLILFRLFEKNRLIGAPPHVILGHHQNMSVVHDMWTDDLRSFIDPEHTAAWHSLCAKIHSTAPLPGDLRNELVQILLTNAKNAARMAAFMSHRRLSMLVNIYATIDVPFVNHAGPFAGGYAGSQAGQEPPPLQPQHRDAAHLIRPTPVRVRGLTREEIERNLLLITYDSELPETCTICLEDIAKGSTGGWLSCTHTFHPTCISRWLGVNASCPICRMEVHPDNFARSVI